MLTTPRQNSKLLLLFLFCFTLLLTFLLCLPWVSAKETPKPKPQQWQIDGISAALDDGYDNVKRYALKQLVEYNLKDLKSLGKKPEEIAQKAANILKDEKVDSDVRGSAASALGNLGEAYIPDIANILKDEKVDLWVRGSAALALENIKQLTLEEVVVVLNYVYEPNQESLKYDGTFEYWRFWTYFLSGGNDEVKTLLTWVGRPERKAVPPKLTHNEGKKTLEVFLKAWEPTQGLTELRKDLAKQISEVAANKNVTWKLDNLLLLQSHYNNLKQVNSTNANAVKLAIDNLKGRQ